MIFNSYIFVLFFSVVLLLYRLPFSWTAKKTILLLASYVFYAAWNPPFILLLWLSTVIDFFVGKALYELKDKSKRRLLLVISLAGNLGMLSFFKYGGFLLENFVQLVNTLGFSFHPARPNIILPAGISFYTFTTLCYTIDMYKRDGQPVRSLLDFSLFVTFFPHLVAGPIVRPYQLVPQFEQPRKADRRQLLDGLLLLSLGLFMKVVLADTMLAETADKVFAARNGLDALDAWTGVLAFSGQIFFDFAGYSTAAIGVALCLGFVLPSNFVYPYAAVGFSDFWRRWHITLSAWLRDYLYIPLGGNRKGTFKTYRNMMITMLIGGLWHGANWTFVAWGGLHGCYLWVEKGMKDWRDKAASKEGLALQAIRRPRFIGALLTFLLVCITWVFFRADSFSGAWQLLAGMSGQAHSHGPLLKTMAILKVLVVITGMLIFHWLLRGASILETTGKMPWWAVGALWAAMLILLVMSQESGRSFIYFQF